MKPGIIYLDSRVGSRELAPIITKRHGLRTELITLNSADIAFTCGHSEPSPHCGGDFGCRLGFERKTLGDLVGSLLKNRLGGRQIPLMLAEYTTAGIVIEGDWREAPDGGIEEAVWRSRKDDGIEIVRWRRARCPLTYHQLLAWLTRYMVLGGGKLQRDRTKDMNDTAAWIAATYGWWRKEWKKHSLGVVDKMALPSKAMLWQPNQKEKTLSTLPNIGIKTVKTISRHFPSIMDAMLASPGQLVSAGLGKKDARTVYEVIRKEYR